MRKTLENICNQDFKNWELIIVDDGSTDNGKVIIEEYVKRDKRIFAYYQKNTRFLKKSFIRSLKWGFTMEDIFYLSSVKQERGLDYPFARQFAISLNVVFK